MNIDQFRDAIRDAGMEPPEVIEPGRIQRFPGTGKRNGNTAAWCKLFNDGLGGCFGDWSSGFSGNWQAKRDKPLTATERAAFHRHVAEAQAQAEVEERSRHETASARAAEILAVATGDPVTHPYASRKRVSFGPLVKRGAWPQRGWRDALLVPVYGADERVWSIEAINVDGSKDSLKDARKRGGFHPFGKIRGASLVLIAEGPANAAVGWAVDGSPAAAALGKSNLTHTSLAVRKLAPEAEIILLADNDLKVPREAQDAARAVGGLVAVPELERRKCDFWDVWHERGVEAVQSAIASAKAPDGDEARPGNGAAPGGAKAKGGEEKAPADEESRLRAVEIYVLSGDPPTQRARPQTDILIDIGLNVSKALFCGDDDRAYAVIRDTAEIWPIASRRFREWLRGCYFKHVGKGANSNSVRDAIETISSKAQFSGDKRKVFLRTAEANGKLYIDMTDDAWRVVEIDRDGWRVLDHSPVMFTRRGTPAPLPVPERGGSLSELWPFLNVPEKYRPLVAGWQLAALYPSGPYPILVLQGEEGTTKTTAALILRSLCDPAMVPLRTPTRDEKDFLVGCIGNWCVCLDNLSGMQPWMSDALCRLSTGGGFAARTLYTDCDETAIQIQRPVILNGIDVGAVRGDLISRTVALTLCPIPDEKRMDPDDLKAAFEKARPRILGALFSGLAQAVREKPNVTLLQKPRMAGFARLVVAAETALGFKAGEFMAAYQENLTEEVMAAIEASPVAQALIEFMQGRQEWAGTAKQLLDAITPLSIDPGSPPPRGWPVSGRGMSAVLTRFASALRKVGIDIEHLERSGTKGRRLRLAWKVPAQPTQPTQPSETSCGAGFRGDGSIRGDDSTDTATGNRHQPTPENGNEFNANDASDDSDDSDGYAGTLHTPGPPPWGTRL